MAVKKWDYTPWYLRLFGLPEYRRLTESGWEYYDEKKHGKGMWF